MSPPNPRPPHHHDPIHKSLHLPSNAQNPHSIPLRPLPLPRRSNLHKRIAPKTIHRRTIPQPPLSRRPESTPLRFENQARGIILSEGSIEIRRDFADEISRDWRGGDFVGTFGAGGGEGGEDGRFGDYREFTH